MRALKTLRSDGKAHTLAEIVSNTDELAILKKMHYLGWVQIRTNKPRVWITMKGRKVFKCFERIYS